MPKNPVLLRKGAVLTADATGTRWVRRHAELRRPYLHLFAGTGTGGDEVGVVRVADSRIDAAPELAGLLGGGGGGGGAGLSPQAHVFAVYADHKAWLFAVRTEREKSEWIFAIDQCYYGEEGEDGA